MSTSPICARPAVRVGVVTDAELVRHGVHAMLAPFARRVRLVDLSPGPGASRRADPVRVDVALLDAWSCRVVDRVALRAIEADPSVGRAVLYTSHDEVDDTAPGHSPRTPSLSKQLGALELVDALEALGAEGPAVREELPLGEAEGLTPRQAEMVSLITAGLTNQQIVDRTGLSANTVKSYIRTAYWRMGVTTRARAVRWGLERGYVRTGLAPAS